MTTSLSAADRARRRIINRKVNPLLSSLPDWVESYRPHQAKAIGEIMSAYDEGVKMVVLDAPTGAGKTLIAETVRRLLSTTALYVCTTKSLQNQFLHDYPYAQVIKGRGNYPTERFPERYHPDEYFNHLSCEDCTWSKDKGCAWCSSKARCPYEIAKDSALGADVAVLNTSYFLAECNHIGKFSGSPLVVMDEADTLESELMSFVSVDVSERRMEKWNWQPPSKITVKDSWTEWIDDKLPQLSTILSQLPTDSLDLRAQRERKFIEGLREKLRVIRQGLNDTDTPWVYTGKGVEGSGRIKAKNQGRTVSFKPSRVETMGKDTLWRHGNRWLLMSATVISSQQLLESLGWTDDYRTVNVGSTFPVENRRIHYIPAAPMSAKTKADAWPKVAEEVTRIVRERPSDRILVHTVSYDLTRFLYERLTSLRRTIVTYTNAGEREQALGRYLANAGSVILAPSLDRGIDLIGDLCRVQIIVKVPFPNLGDRQVNARLHSRGGDLWYRVATIRTLVQMTGRAVRSETDFAESFILDTNFGDLVLSRGRGLVPRWWADAIVWPERRTARG